MFFHRLKFAFSINKDKICRVDLHRKSWGTLIRSVQSELLSPEVMHPSPSGENILHSEAYRLACLNILTDIPRTSRYYLSLPETCVRVKVLEFQTLPKDKQEREQLIAWQMSKAFLSPLKPVQLVFQEVGKYQEKRCLLVMTVENEIFEAYVAPFRERGMEAANIGIFPLHLYNLYQSSLLQASLPKQNFIFIILSHFTYTLLICREGIIDFVRIKQRKKPVNGVNDEGSDPIVSETLSSLTTYLESRKNVEPTHLFLVGNMPLSHLDLPFKETLGLTPSHLPLVDSRFCRFNASVKNPGYAEMAAATAMLGGKE